jgi:LPXTG-motif cell wall-anchored protein
MVTVSFAALATFLGQEAVNLLSSPWITVSGFLVLILIVWLLWRKFRELLRRT